MSSLYAGQGLRGPTGQGLGSRSPGQGLQGPGRSTPRGYEQVQNFTPEQMDLFKQLFSNVGPNSFLSKLAGGDEGTFNQIEAPALRQFNGLQGGLASRFSQGGGGPGAMSSRHSSGFQNSANQAASDFAGQLQGNRQNLQQQALHDLMGYSNELLGQQPYSLNEKQKPFWQQLLTSMGSGFGQIAGNAGNSWLQKLMGL